MLKLETPVGVISKIGPKFKSLLTNLEINSVGELLYHFPFRYDDFTLNKKIKELAESENVNVEATLVDVTNIFTRYGKKITKATVTDETGKMDLIWFNQHYIKNSLIPMQRYVFKGRVGKFGSKMTLYAPNFELVKEGAPLSKQLIPVYPETSGISSKWINSRINDVLNGDLGEHLEPISNVVLDEFLPKEIIEKYGFLEIEEALRKIHFPKELYDASIARKRFAFEELFIELLNVEKRKSEWSEKYKAPVFHIKKFAGAVTRLKNSLPFELTDSQDMAIEQILDDMLKPNPMNKLLEGDVGTGKTIVAVFAAYLASLNGYRVLYMAPTEILADQHLETFKKFLEPLGVKILAKTGSKKTILQDEEFDIAIGTHALVYSEIRIPKVGLVIVDEQHRFGVEQRAKILELAKWPTILVKPHMLTMTATPIPRTLALTLYGDLSIAVLKTSPNKDKKITTKVIPENMRTKAYEWIRKKGESAFIVCPFIQESEIENMDNIKAAEKEFKILSEGVFSGIPIGLLHGKMKSAEKADIIEKFRNGKIRILVSTPVIEVGIDVPEATIMVIESAERYGLASLHQLRGRVGRGTKEGFCMIFMSEASQNAYARLKNLETVSNGLELAEIDLEYRGSGDIFGTVQHGFRKFRVADVNDFELLEKCKMEAQLFAPQLDNYPKLAEKLNSTKGKLVANN